MSVVAREAKHERSGQDDCLAMVSGVVWHWRVCEMGRQ
jgi:hypothetical protein